MVRDGGSAAWVSESNKRLSVNLFQHAALVSMLKVYYLSFEKLLANGIGKRPCDKCTTTSLITLVNGGDHLVLLAIASLTDQVLSRC